MLQQKEMGLLLHMFSRCLLRQPSSMTVVPSTTTDYKERREIRAYE